LILHPFVASRHGLVLNRVGANARFSFGFRSGLNRFSFLPSEHALA
jgi:hypothetical protein